jgi:hypothetical protein
MSAMELGRSRFMRNCTPSPAGVCTDHGPFDTRARNTHSTAENQ